MTQAFNLSQLANGVNTSGQVNASSYLYNQVPVANGGTALSSAGAAGNMLLATSASAYASVTMPTFGFRNRIINGAMVIDQRNAGAAITANGYSVDRFEYANFTDGAFSVQQDATVPAGFIKSLKVTVTSADASVTTNQSAFISQKIEGLNCADLGWGAAGAQSVTFSFWVRSSLTGTFGGSFRNNATDRSYPYSYTISAANTWEQKTITIAGDTTGTWLTTNGVGINIGFSLAAGPSVVGTANTWAAANYVSASSTTNVVSTLNATFYITGVQLEKGSTATSFDYRPYGTELALCQRYYETGLFDVRANTSGSTVAIFSSVEKRTASYTPAYTQAASASNNISGTPTITVMSTRQLRLAFVAVTSGDTYYVRVFEMPAEL